MAAQYGAHEMMEIHEVLTDAIDGINQFQLYRPHVKDARLLTMLDNQIRHMTQEYNNMVNMMNHTGRGEAVPYRAPSKMAAPVYGLNNPATQMPNVSMTDMNDRDVASGMLGCHKASACTRMVASLECADPQIRRMIQQGAINCSEQAYEVWQYMNHQGYYQVPTMKDMTTNTMMNSYTTANTAQMNMIQPTPVNQPINQYRMMQ